MTWMSFDPGVATSLFSHHLVLQRQENSWSLRVDNRGKVSWLAVATWSQTPIWWGNCWFDRLKGWFHSYPGPFLAFFSMKIDFLISQNFLFFVWFKPKLRPWRAHGRPFGPCFGAMATAEIETRGSSQGSDQGHWEEIDVTKNGEAIRWEPLKRMQQLQVIMKSMVTSVMYLPNAFGRTASWLWLFSFAWCWISSTDHFFELLLGGRWKLSSRALATCGARAAVP